MHLNNLRYAPGPDWRLLLLGWETGHIEPYDNHPIEQS